MKKYILLLLALGLLGACKKELSYSFAFILDGNTYRGYNYTATYNLDTVAGLREFAADFYIGNFSDTNYVQVSFSSNNFVAPGIYYSGVNNINNTQCSFAYYKNHVYYNNVNGIVEILQIDTIGHKIKGNFQFKAVSSINARDSAIVTNGAFTGIRYTVQ